MTSVWSWHVCRLQFFHVYTNLCPESIVEASVIFCEHKYSEVFVPFRSTIISVLSVPAEFEINNPTVWLIISSSTLTSAVISDCSTALFSSPCVEVFLYEPVMYDVFVLRMIWHAGPQDLLSPVPRRCYPPHPAGRGSGWCNLLLPVCRCSDSQLALPWKLGHTDYMFWSAPMPVMQM